MIVGIDIVDSLCDASSGSCLEFLNYSELEDLSRFLLGLSAS